MADKHYFMWIKSQCPFCQKIQALAKENAISHTVYVMDEDLVGLDKVKEHWDWQTVPLVTTYDGDHEVLIGGCDDFQKKLSLN